MHLIDCSGNTASFHSPLLPGKHIIERQTHNCRPASVPFKLKGIERCASMKRRRWGRTLISGVGRNCENSRMWARENWKARRLQTHLFTSIKTFKYFLPQTNISSVNWISSTIFSFFTSDHLIRKGFVGPTSPIVTIPLTAHFPFFLPPSIQALSNNLAQWPDICTDLLLFSSHDPLVANIDCRSTHLGNICIIVLANLWKSRVPHYV